MCIDDLEKVCEVCGGSGFDKTAPKKKNNCFHCNGRGRVLSIEGEKLMEFLRYYGRYVTIEDVMDEIEKRI